MFTVKVCNPGMTTYFETDAVSSESLHNGRQLISFSAQGDERSMLIARQDDEANEVNGAPIVNRIYLINEHGKTVDIFK